MRQMSTKPMRTPIIPIDPSDWTLEDWRDLHSGIERIKERIAARYAQRNPPPESPPVDNAHVAAGCEQFRNPIARVPLTWDVRVLGEVEGSKRTFRVRASTEFDAIQLAFALDGGWNPNETNATEMFALAKSYASVQPGETPE